MIRAEFFLPNRERPAQQFFRLAKLSLIVKRRGEASSGVEQFFRVVPGQTLSSPQRLAKHALGLRRTTAHHDDPGQLGLELNAAHRWSIMKSFFDIEGPASLLFGFL